MQYSEREQELTKALENAARIIEKHEEQIYIGEILDLAIQIRALLARPFGIAGETHYGMKGSGNYTADKEINPTAVWFANGRHVKIVDGHLEIGWGKP